MVHPQALANRLFQSGDIEIQTTRRHDTFDIPSFASSLITHSSGTDASVLMQLTTEDSEADFEYSVAILRNPVDYQDGRISVPNLVVGKAYVIVLQHNDVAIVKVHTLDW